jgi:tryptophan-rich sensory protein
VINLKKTTKYILYLITPLIVGFLSNILTSNYRDFYKTLIKPPLAPPGYLFGIVWTILFILIGISYFLLKLKTEWIDISNIDFWYYLQLIINFFWSIFFFKNQALTFSFIWLLFLLIIVVITFLKFYKTNKISSYLFIPYILWIIFAGYLNLSIAILN